MFTQYNYAQYYIIFLDKTPNLKFAFDSSSKVIQETEIQNIHEGTKISKRIIQSRDQIKVVLKQMFLM